MTQPDILLIMTDQQRADALGAEGHPVLSTPNLDHLANTGTRFTSAYSACPICVPARRTLMSRRRPMSHGAVANHHAHLDGPWLAEELRNIGYQTQLCGKLHLHPFRKSYGFEGQNWSDSPQYPQRDDDYQRFLQSQGVNGTEVSRAHGLSNNGIGGKPWHLEERLRFSNWVTDSAIRFLERRDPTRPFFLNLGYLHPHQPLTPPKRLLDKYLAMDLPKPVVGEWADALQPKRNTYSPIKESHVVLPEDFMYIQQAAYYASIEYIDEQIGRLWHLIPKDTVVMFTSDHGEMLGDHHFMLKSKPWEGSARIPMLLSLPNTVKLDRDLVQHQVVDDPVELMDVMPTFLDLAGCTIPDSIDGESMLPLLGGNSSDWRSYLHGECANMQCLNSGMHYLTDGRQKYIWLPGANIEQFFNLENDPNELCDLSKVSQHAEIVSLWRQRLVDQLSGRSEEFVQDGKLVSLTGATPKWLGN